MVIRAMITEDIADLGECIVPGHWIKSNSAAGPVNVEAPNSTAIGSWLHNWINKGASLPPNSIPSTFLQIANTVVIQVQETTIKEFQNPGLPWTVYECRSVIAGGSGVLYCLPALFCKSDNITQCIWVTQALLSVMADYVYVGRKSCIHGVDRCFATANTFAIIFQAAFGLKSITMILAIFPISCFLLANRSKRKFDLKMWIWYHFLWHLSGSVNAAFATYLLYTCPDYNNEDSSTLHSLLNHVCSTKAPSIKS